MSFWNQSLIDFRNLKTSDILFLFEKAKSIQPYQFNFQKNAGLLFLEPSTRTQLSFDLACRDLGINPINFLPENSSLKKGETILDTLLTLQALQFDLFIIRHGIEGESLRALNEKLKVPIINAGEGVSGHPTQALLDLYTIFDAKKDFKNEKILFVGDIKHSRVVSSNIELFNMFGIEFAFCGPKELLPNGEKHVFEKLEEGMKWATVIMPLRNQLERHKNIEFDEFKKDFIQKYCITKARLNQCGQDKMILHPGPYNRDVEISSDALDDPRIYIFKQVENGRKVRRALIHSIFSEK